MTRSYRPRPSGLPDPDYHAEFYRDVPAKRLIAWGIDVILISAIVVVLTFLGFLIPLFFLPFLYFCVSFLYRWSSLASRSATPGMRFAAIELRDRGGQPLDGGTAFLHTAGYAFSVVTFPLQLVSMAMMLMTLRRQGLTDTVLGTAAINRRAG
ncbi:MAG: RDD family protein [Silicimonas sp.]|nr:RDD family protein [Silicimonas sp.]